MYVVLAILLFGMLIAVHEWGHFMAARLCGVTVHEFSIGMGPALWKKQGRQGTQYSLRAFPIGGYCAMEGEEEESDDPHSLSNCGFWQKAFVFVAGAAMNFLVGALMVLILNLGAEAYRTTEITGFAPEFTLQGENGLQLGDSIYRVNGNRIYLFSDISLFLTEREQGGMDLEIVRDGEHIVLCDFPMEKKTCTDTESGQTYVGYGLYFGKVEEATLGRKLRMTCYNCLDFVRTVWYSLRMLVSGRAGAEDLSGPVGIVSTINEVGEQSASVSDALWNIVYLGGLIAINLAVFNLLPIPALDGGHILFLAVATVIEKLFGKKVPKKYETVISSVFMVLMLGLMLFVTFNDVVKLFR